MTEVIEAMDRLAALDPETLGIIRRDKELKATFKENGSLLIRTCEMMAAFGDKEAWRRTADYVERIYESI